MQFYVFDRPIEVMARQLLLLQLAFDWEVPVRQRANVFLEVLGNCLVQDRTSVYLSTKRLEMVDLLCNSRGVLASVFDPSMLLYRQRDELEFTFKTWDHRIKYDVHALRDQRLRHHFATRYDFRNNLIDWDYHSTIKPSAGCLHYVHYRHWRNTGVAFEVRVVVRSLWVAIACSVHTACVFCSLGTKPTPPRTAPWRRTSKARSGAAAPPCGGGFGRTWSSVRTTPWGPPPPFTTTTPKSCLTSTTASLAASSTDTCVCL